MSTCERCGYVTDVERCPDYRARPQGGVYEATVFLCQVCAEIHGDGEATTRNVNKLFNALADALHVRAAFVANLEREGGEAGG